MSTLTMQLDGIPSSTAAAPPAKLLARLMQSREASAKRHTLAFLGSQSEERLQALGFSAEDVHALLKGELRLPAAR